MGKNIAIREALKRAGLYQWELADYLGVHESVLSRRLRYELPEAERDALLEEISRCAEERGVEHGGRK